MCTYDCEDAVQSDFFHFLLLGKRFRDESVSDPSRDQDPALIGLLQLPRPFASMAMPESKFPRVCLLKSDIIP